MNNSNINEEEETYPLAIDVEVDEIDEDDIKAFNKRLKKLKKFIEYNNITSKNFRTKKNMMIKDVKKALEQLDLTISSGSFIKTRTYSGLLEDERRIRSGALKSILAGLDVDEKIIVLRELLNELEGDWEPPEYYIR